MATNTPTLLDDILNGTKNADTISGLAGNDKISGGAGDDSLLGGDGPGLASYAAATAGVTVDLTITVAQDTGGAIKGPIRFDFFWGFGDEAGKNAGRQKSQARAWLLLPNGVTPESL